MVIRLNFFFRNGLDTNHLSISVRNSFPIFDLTVFDHGILYQIAFLRLMRLLVLFSGRLHSKIWLYLAFWRVF